jgi:hypothetical protein
MDYSALQAHSIIKTDILDTKADISLIDGMLEKCLTKLEEIKACNYRNRGGIHKKIVYMLSQELLSIKKPENFTVKELFSHLLTAELIKIKYYTWGNWAVGPRWVCCRQTLNLVKIMFSDSVALEAHKKFVSTGDCAVFGRQINTMGLELLNFFWRYDFAAEIKAVDEYKENEADKATLPHKELDRLATITKKEYIGLLNGNITVSQKIVALNEYFLENIELVDGRPFRKDSGRPVVFDDFKAYSIIKRDREILNLIYTELLELYKHSSPAKREAYKNGLPVRFNSKRLLRKMTKNSKTYDLQDKLRQHSSMFYSIKTDRQSDVLTITKVFDVENCDSNMFKINASFLMGLIEEISPENYVYFLPIGGRKCSQHVQVITEHIITELAASGGRRTKKSVNLWEIINQYTQIAMSYEEYETTRSKNIWLKRLVEGLYKTLYSYVAPRYKSFTVSPLIKNNKTEKWINIPTSTTIKNHKIYISHNGLQCDTML